MSGTAARIGGGFLALAAIWIGVYWFWEPARSESLTFADEAERAQPAPEPEPEQHLPPPVEVPVPAPEAAPDADAGPAVIAPEFTQCTVRQGDTFGSISRRVYGSTRHADAIAAANPFVSPTNLRAGDILRVPVDPDNVQGVPVEGAGGEPPEPQLIEYVVTRGDTLSEIAQRFYGSLRYAEVIYNANRDTMQSMDDLQIGDVLRIPTPESVLGKPDR